MHFWAAGGSSESCTALLSAPAEQNSEKTNGSSMAKPNTLHTDINRAITGFFIMVMSHQASSEWWSSARSGMASLQPGAGDERASDDAASDASCGGVCSVF